MSWRVEPSASSEMVSKADALEWLTQVSARNLCVKIEAMCVPHGFHVALTGGCLYKTGLRKDIDLVFYSVRQDRRPLQDRRVALEGEMVSGLGFLLGPCFGWLTKMTAPTGHSVDLLYPEYEQGGTYPNFA